MCKATVENKDAIIAIIGGKAEKYPMCRKHQKTAMRLLLNTGTASEVFIPSPRKRTDPR